MLQAWIFDEHMGVNVDAISQMQSSPEALYINYIASQISNFGYKQTLGN